jgi:hypothetical protein
VARFRQCLLCIAFQFKEDRNARVISYLVGLIGFFRFTIHVFGKYFYDRSTKDWPLVEEPRRSLFNGLSRRKKLSQAGAAFRTPRSREFVQRSVADLTQYDLVVVQHRKPEGPPFLIVSFDSMANQRHELYSPQTGTTPA